MHKINPDIHVLGKLCKHNHQYKSTGQSIRYKDGKCVVCQVNYARNWDKKHPKRRQQIYKKWLKDNKERRNEIDRNFREERRKAVCLVRQLIDHQTTEELFERRKNACD